MIIKLIILIILSFLVGHFAYNTSKPVAMQAEIYRSSFGKLIMGLLTIAMIPILIWIWATNGFKYALFSFFLSVIVYWITNYSLNR